MEEKLLGGHIGRALGSRRSRSVSDLGNDDQRPFNRFNRFFFFFWKESHVAQTIPRLPM